MSFIGLAVMTCNGSPFQQGIYQTYSTATVLPAAKTSDAKHWKRHTLFNSFSVSIPVTVEMQTKNSPYGRQIANSGYQFRDDVVVFNQKGLCNLDQKAQKQYCRIMFSCYKGVPGDFLRRNETETLDADYRQMLKELVVSEIGYNSRLMGTIDYTWVRINNANAILVSYRRTGNNFDATIPVNCKMLIFQDNNRLVKMMLTYREKEASLWANDFEQVLRSFEWKN